MLHTKPVVSVLVKEAGARCFSREAANEYNLVTDSQLVPSNKSSPSAGSAVHEGRPAESPALRYP